MKNKISLWPEDTDVLFAAMSREELRRVATICHIPRGDTKGELIQNLMDGVNMGKVDVKFSAQINIPSAAGGRGIPIFIKTLATFQAESILPA
jgi:hypothetical protein